jgi:hypothetical protein
MENKSMDENSNNINYRLKKKIWNNEHKYAKKSKQKYRKNVFLTGIK